MRILDFARVLSPGELASEIKPKRRPSTNGSAGFSIATIYKEYEFNRSLEHLIPMSQYASKNWAERWGVDRPCVIMDMTCGPGQYRELINGSLFNVNNTTFTVGTRKDEFPLNDMFSSDGKFLTIAGSPLILAKQIDNWQKKTGIKTHLICVDHDTTALHDASTLVQELYPDVSVQFHDSQREVIEALPYKAIGFSYWDTNGYNHLDRELLSYHGQKHTKMDVLITRACVDALRIQAVHGSVAFIDDYLGDTRKTNCYIKRYANWRWWSFGFSSNCPEERRLGRLKALGFLNYKKSQEGAEELAKLQRKLADE